ncbi:MAG: hypothetical protein HC859_02235 [Bacteroidia bacterium]|nr:hypothetical protein [Bacteroidia bacterium]
MAYEEKKLFEYFLDSTDLSAEKRKVAYKIFDEGIRNRRESTFLSRIHGS